MISDLISRASPLGEKETDRNRRALLIGASAVAALGAANPLFAASQEHPAHASKASGLIGAAEECENTGEACLAHCFERFKAGDLTLAACAVAVDDTIAVCSATVKLGMNGSAHLKHIASVCKGVCEDCEKECLKHVEKHAICKDMADSCKATIKECEAILA